MTCGISLSSSRPQTLKTRRLAERRDLVGKEHHPELAGDSRESRVGKGPGLGVGLLPGDRACAALRCGEVEHCLVEIAGGDGNPGGEAPRQGPGDDPRPGGDLQQRPLPQIGEPVGEVGRIRLEDQRPEEAIIEGRDGAGEGAVGSGHSCAA